MQVNPYLTILDSWRIFGLKSDGTVLCSRFRKNNRLLNPSEEYVGCKFFDEVADFENAENFRQIFKKFATSEKFIESFIFFCLYGEESVAVGIMMAPPSKTVTTIRKALSSRTLKIAATEI